MKSLVSQLRSHARIRTSTPSPRCVAWSHRLRHVSYMCTSIPPILPCALYGLEFHVGSPKEHSDAWEACGKQPYLEATRLYESSSLNTQVMRVAIHLAKKGDNG